MAYLARAGFHWQCGLVFELPGTSQEQLPTRMLRGCEASRTEILLLAFGVLVLVIQLIVVVYCGVMKARMDRHLTQVKEASLQDATEPGVTRRTFVFEVTKDNNNISG